MPLARSKQTLVLGNPRSRATHPLVRNDLFALYTTPGKSLRPAHITSKLPRVPSPENCGEDFDLGGGGGGGGGGGWGGGGAGGGGVGCWGGGGGVGGGGGGRETFIVNSIT